MPRKPCPVTIRGVNYASMGEAANALGVKKATIGAARDAGTLDYVGLGHRNGGGNQKPVTIGGRNFASIREAAESLSLPYTELSSYFKIRAKLIDIGVGE